MSRNIRSLIVEDEPLAREGLLMYVNEIEFIDVVGVCEDALSANKALSETPVDLMFLDIQMPKLSGLDFLRSIPRPPMTIITTAFPNFALQGFDLDVIDYLVKPYAFDRFLKAVNKARDLSNFVGGRSSDNFFYIKVDYKYEKIFFEEVMYVQGMENYVTIVTQRGKYITQLRMKTMEEMLPSATFVRTHKSYIVSRNAISSIEGNTISVGNVQLPISREKRTEILTRLIGKS